MIIVFNNDCLKVLFDRKVVFQENKILLSSARLAIKENEQIERHTSLKDKKNGK